MILADTSAWIEYDRATGSPVHLRMRELIGAEEPLAVTEPVRMEVLAGARDDRREQQLRDLLGRCRMLALDAPVDFDRAAGLYRHCRSVGITPRGLLDCLIAAVAARTGSSLLCLDVDLVRLAAATGVELDQASAPG